MKRKFVEFNTVVVQKSPQHKELEKLGLITDENFEEERLGKYALDISLISEIRENSVEYEGRLHEVVVVTYGENMHSPCLLISYEEMVKLLKKEGIWV